MKRNFILYPDTEKELFFETDYKPLPPLDGLSLPDIRSLLENVNAAAGNAVMNGASLLEMALIDDIQTLKKAEREKVKAALQTGYIMPVVYINCSEYPFIKQIMQRKKLFETRNKNTLKSFVGKRIFLAETGKGKTVVRCCATVTEVIKISSKKEFNQYRKAACIVRGSAFDWTSATKQKYFYRLTNVHAVPAFVPEGVRHGRIWMEYTTDKNN